MVIIGWIFLVLAPALGASWGKRALGNWNFGEDNKEEGRQKE